MRLHTLWLREPKLDRIHFLTAELVWTMPPRHVRLYSGPSWAQHMLHLGHLKAMLVPGGGSWPHPATRGGVWPHHESLKFIFNQWNSILNHLGLIFRKALYI